MFCEGIAKSDHQFGSAVLAWRVLGVVAVGKARTALLATLLFGGLGCAQTTTSEPPAEGTAGSERSETDAEACTGRAKYAGPARLRPVWRGPAPPYPKRARESRVQGHVRIDFRVGPDGSGQNAKVVESEPPGVFDESAMSAVPQFRYCPPEPGVFDYPTPMKVMIPFRLAD